MSSSFDLLQVVLDRQTNQNFHSKNPEGLAVLISLNSVQVEQNREMIIIDRCNLTVTRVKKIKKDMKKYEKRRGCFLKDDDRVVGWFEGCYFFPQV